MLVKQDAGTSALLAQRTVLFIPIRGMGQRESARRGYIAVHPTLGWWRTQTGEKRYDRTVPYSLIVTTTPKRSNRHLYAGDSYANLGIDIPIEI